MVRHDHIRYRRLPSPVEPRTEPRYVLKTESRAPRPHLGAACAGHRVAVAPGAETGWHRHEADYVVVPMLDGDLLLEEPGGGARTTTLKRHVPYARREGVEHNVVNANAYDFAFMEIEHLKT